MPFAKRIFAFVLIPVLMIISFPTVKQKPVDNKVYALSSNEPTLAELLDFEEYYTGPTQNLMPVPVPPPPQLVPVVKKKPQPAPPPVQTAQAPPDSATVSDGSVWDRLAQCESGGNWAINTGNSYYGGLQMNMSFWNSYGGPEFASRPDLAGRDAQIIVAERARDSGRGYGPWPGCSEKLGLR